MNPEISVVVPVFGCRNCLAELWRRLVSVLEQLSTSFEIVMVDDRSPDGAWETIVELAEQDHRVQGVRLSRNFGEHAAVTAGLARARGRWMVIMDCDLQDRPEEIPRLYRKALEGFEIVFSRRARRSQSVRRTLASRMYYRLLNFVLKTDLDPERGSLAILSRKVVDAFVTMREKEYKLALEWLGFERTTLDLERADRPSGRSSYSASALFRVALDGIFFQSTALIRWIVLLGFAVAGLGALLAAYFAYDHFVADQTVAGWTSIAVLLLLLSGFIIVSMGVAALYIARIFDEVKGRPHYVIDDERSSEAAASSSHPHEPRVTQEDAQTRW